MARLVFRAHALRRMFQRGITMDDVRAVVALGEIIDDYPWDTPYPSRLLLGWGSSGPVHVVIAQAVDSDEIIIVTAYVPDPAGWDPTFRRRL